MLGSGVKGLPKMNTNTNSGHVRPLGGEKPFFVLWTSQGRPGMLQMLLEPDQGGGQGQLVCVLWCAGGVEKTSHERDDCRSVECGPGKRIVTAGKKTIFKPMPCRHPRREIQMWFR